MLLVIFVIIAVLVVAAAAWGYMGSALFLYFSMDVWYDGGIFIVKSFPGSLPSPGHGNYQYFRFVLGQDINQQPTPRTAGCSNTRGVGAGRLPAWFLHILYVLFGWWYDELQF